MDEFAPLLIVLLFWVFIGSGLKKVAKNATKGKKGPQKTGTASLKGVKDAFFPAEAFPEKASPEKAAAAAPAEKAAPAAAVQPASNPPVPASAPLRPAPMVSALRESAPADRPQPAPMISTLRESAPADRPQPLPPSSSFIYIIPHFAAFGHKKGFPARGRKPAATRLSPFLRFIFPHSSCPRHVRHGTIRYGSPLPCNGDDMMRIM